MLVASLSIVRIHRFTPLQALGNYVLVILNHLIVSWFPEHACHSMPSEFASNNMLLKLKPMSSGIMSIVILSSLLIMSWPKFLLPAHNYVTAHPSFVHWSQWKKEKLIGSGSFGQVYLASNRYSIDPFCVSTMKNKISATVWNSCIRATFQAYTLVDIYDGAHKYSYFFMGLSLSMHVILKLMGAFGFWEALVLYILRLFVDVHRPVSCF